ncbi:unnamed protein product [Adineta steineri]|uniref:Autocrine proliferation repressor A-like n=1 Tax=Adineta steineri TaxID=433720 RepID=A0A814FF61_9BILA|nr:unnamed protein product [Adineta steineri]CAF1013266.1 unnamed protein product [Adineta steineri]CAF1051880.1 unnamed protein product [Adineta steineri]
MYQNKLFLSFCLLIFIVISKSYSTPLDDYVRAEDPHFGWSLIRTYEEIDYKLYVLNFTSQKWLDETYSSRPIWWHYLCITVPNKITRPNSAYMLIDQGSNNDRIPQPQDDFVALTAMVAVGIGSIAVDLQDVPNGPIRFTGDPTNRTRGDDASIGWTWRSFIENSSNIYVPLNLPMTKAAYRAMDAVQQFTDKQNITTPQKFVVAGASKRGWATWLTAAVDTERVVGAIPIVMDVLNFRTNLHHMYRSLAGWTFAFKDYYQLNITQFVDNENMTKLSEIIDPLYYIDRFSKMKLLQIQATAAFWKQLQDATGGSYLRRMPNADHVCVGHITSLFFTMRSFYMSIYDNRPLPKLQWIKTSNNTHGYIRATVDFSVGPRPISAYGYRARTLTDKRRDFRLLIGNPSDPTKAYANPVFWFNTPVVIENETNTTIDYSLTIENPRDGWEGFLIQVNFPGPDGTVLELTTETQIIPDTYPTNDCHDEQCFGTLV